MADSMPQVKTDFDGINSSCGCDLSASRMTNRRTCKTHKLLLLLLPTVMSQTSAAAECSRANWWLFALVLNDGAPAWQVLFVSEAAEA